MLPFYLIACLFRNILPVQELLWASSVKNNTFIYLLSLFANTLRQMKVSEQSVLTATSNMKPLSLR